MKDYYYILGVEANCTADDIKDAYRKLSKKFHPDLDPGDEYFAGRFREIKEAYDVLGDPEERSRYDILLQKIKMNIPGGRPGFTAAHGATKPSPGQKHRGAGIGIAVAILVLIGIIGIYLVESFATIKPKATKVIADVVVVDHPHKKHRKRHDLFARVDANKPGRRLDTMRKVIARSLAVNPRSAKAMIVKNGVDSARKPKIDTARNMTKDFLYAAYVHPNITGIVKMRAYNKFDSAIIADIPANSKVLVLKTGDPYYRVYYASYVGYVPKWALQAK